MLKDYESYYDKLEIHPECTKTEIRCHNTSIMGIGDVYLFHHLALPSLTFREAWLRLSMQYHPDLNQDDEKAAQRFLEIKEAYTGEPPSWTFL